MDWTARLAERREIAECPDGGPPELTKGACVSFGSDPDGSFGKIAEPTAIPAAVYSRLVRLAESEGRDPALVDRVPAADLPDYAGMDDAQLSALLSMLADDADREAGRVPHGDKAAILCRSCGPVWVHPAIAVALPVVDGWPRALGCPWCFIRARGIAIPRPHVRCCDCRHRIPDTINPAQGMGRCAVGNESATWPGMRHRCADFRSIEETR